MTVLIRKTLESGEQQDGTMPDGGICVLNAKIVLIMNTTNLRKLRDQLFKRLSR